MTHKVTVVAHKTTPLQLGIIASRVFQVVSERLGTLEEPHSWEPGCLIITIFNNLIRCYGF